MATTIAFFIGAIVSIFVLYRVRAVSVAGLCALVLASWFSISILISAVPFASAGHALIVSMFFIGWTIYRSRECHHHELIYSLGIMTIALTAYALWQYLSGASPSGPFLNRNNFAALLLIGGFFMAPLAAGTQAVSTRALTRFFALFAITATFAVFGLIDSRGAYVGLTIALIVTGILSGRNNWRPLVLISAVIVAGLLVSQMLNGVLSDTRLLTLSDPLQAGSSRFRIWPTVIEMIKASPVFGTGLGTFYLAWPPFRSPLDGSGGWHAHNDYLQYAAETGLPGLFLIAVVACSLAYAAKRGARIDRTVPWIAGGMAGVCAHSMFTFNLQLPSLLFLVGIGAGFLAGFSPPIRAPYLISTARIVGSGLLFVLVLLVGYAGTSTVSHFYMRSAHTAALRGDITGAYNSATNAIRWWPSSDTPRLGRADLVFQSALSADRANLKSAVGDALDSALQDLDAAHERNPLRAETLATKALYLQHSANMGHLDDVGGEVISLYTEALTLQPRGVTVRLALAAEYEDAGEPRLALETLMSGVRNWYPKNMLGLELLRNAARLAKHQGAMDELAEIERKLAILSREIPG